MLHSCAIFFALLGAVQRCEGHGFLESPPLRGGIQAKPLNAWCPHCGNGQGICGDGGQWGADSDLLGVEGPKTELVAGSIVDIAIKISTNHMGFFEFFICDRHLDHSMTRAEGNLCLEQHKLNRASPPADCVANDIRADCQPIHQKYPSRWYLPPGQGTFNMRYEVPSDLECSSCTLQWQWYTGNSCVPGDDVGCHFKRMRDEGWNVDDWCGVFCGSCPTPSLLQANSTSAKNEVHCGEEFRNCADVTVTTSSTSTARATSQPSTTNPNTKEPESEPESEPCGDTIMAQMPTTRLARVGVHQFLGSSLVQEGSFASRSDIADLDEL